MTPQEAHRRVGHELGATEPQLCPTRRSRIVARAVLFVVVLGATVGFCAATKAAERDRPHDLWLILKNPRPDAQNIFRLGAAYPDRHACEIQKASMRSVAGKLQCLPVEVSYAR